MAADADVAHFRAMGSDAHVIVVGADGDLLARLVAQIGELEQRWSRFIPGSEVSCLNRHAGEAIAVDAVTITLVEQAIEAWRLTGGSFDPTVLGAVLRSGYDGSLTSQLDGRRIVRHSAASELVIACSDIVVDRLASSVLLPPGTGFDAGGIGKGLAADLVTEAALAAGASGVCINIGGDLRVAGQAPHGGSWSIAVDHPAWPAPIAMLDVAAGAVATSTTLRRAWTVDGERRHHLIDPVTGAPSTTDVEVMTVITGDAWRAEALATACLLRGSAGVFDLLDAGSHGLAVTTAGDVLASSGIGPFLRSHAAAVAP